MPTSHPLLSKIIDYAGLFPPASLALEPALRNYATYQASPEAWMLARFICPTGRLTEVEEHLHLFSAKSPLLVSALGSTVVTREAFVSALPNTLNVINAFCARGGERVAVDALEMPFPVTVVEQGPAVIQAVLGEVTLALAQAGLAHLRVFYEMPLTDLWPANLHTLLTTLQAHTNPAQVGFKLRTGGTVASAFPMSEQIAAVIMGCRDRGVALKCTAGLHHPLRRYEASVQTKMYGFLNVFGAGLLAQTHALDLATTQAIIEDETPTHFRLDETGFAWQHLAASHAQITQARQTLMLAFGSCSFEEPRDDLRALGWLSD